MLAQNITGRSTGAHPRHRPRPRDPRSLPSLPPPAPMSRVEPSTTIRIASSNPTPRSYRLLAEATRAPLEPLQQDQAHVAVRTFHHRAAAYQDVILQGSGRPRSRSPSADWIHPGHVLLDGCAAPTHLKEFQNCRIHDRSEHETQDGHPEYR